MCYKHYDSKRKCKNELVERVSVCLRRSVRLLPGDLAPAVPSLPACSPPAAAWHLHLPGPHLQALQSVLAAQQAASPEDAVPYPTHASAINKSINQSKQILRNKFIWLESRYKTRKI